MTLQEISAALDARNEMFEKLDKIYHLVIEAENEYRWPRFSWVGGSYVEEFAIAFREAFHTERVWGSRWAISSSQPFYLSDEDNHITITKTSVRCLGVADSQAGAFNDPIEFPAYLLEAFDGPEWAAALERFTNERAAVVSAHIVKTREEAQRRESMIEASERAELARLIAKHGLPQDTE